MGRFLVLVLLAACGSSSVSQPDAGSGAHCPPPPAGIPLCYSPGLCGNNAVDSCYLPVNPEQVCTSFQMREEECDGAATSTTCDTLGYYGGPSRCSPSCRFDPSGCIACKESTCAVLPLSFSGMAASSGQLAVANPPSLTILDHTLAVTATIPLASSLAITGVSSGWMVMTDAVTVRLLSSTGTLGAPIAIADGPAGQPQMIPGPSGHVMLLWHNTASGDGVWVSVVDSAGAVVTQPFVFTPPGSPSSAAAASDGASFFIASNGTLTRLDANANVISSSNGFPTAATNLVNTIALASGANGGWYLASADSQTYAVQRFDGSGAAVAAPFQIPADFPLSAPVMDGVNLAVVKRVYASGHTAPIHLVEVDPSGAVLSDEEFGVYDNLDAVPMAARLDATHIAIAWGGAAQLQLALVPGP